MQPIKITEIQERDNIIDDLFYKKIIRYEIADFLLGDYLGSGISRCVFESNLNKNHVIKIETGHGGQNVLEYSVWCHVSYVPRIAKWFAPCLRISHGGKILEQLKTKPFKQEIEKPKKVPVFCTDIKESNWGMLKGKPVMHDYAYHLLIEKGMSSKLKPYKW